MSEIIIELKAQLLKKLKKLDEKYPSNDSISLDNWNEEGFPKKIKFQFDFGISDNLDELNIYMKKKYDFKIYLGEEEGLFYNSDLRSNCGSIIEEFPLTILVNTDKYGISPVGLNQINVINLINDCNSLEIIEE